MWFRLESSGIPVREARSFTVQCFCFEYYNKDGRTDVMNWRTPRFIVCAHRQMITKKVFCKLYMRGRLAHIKLIALRKNI